MAEKEYRRLTGARMRWGGFFAVFATRSSLWLGRDHLLRIDSSGYTEEYKRFYFRDIQAITICQTRRRAVLNGVLGILLLPFAAMLMVALFSKGYGDNVGTVIFGAITCFIILVPLLYNIFAGTACSTYIRTAVQVEELPSLARQRRARKAIARLRPLIAEAQGQLTPEEIPARMSELIPRPQNSPTTSVRYAVDDPNQPPRIVP
jgi:hypothetical protein